MNQHAQLKEKLTTILQEGKEVKASWECGGDEALITFYVNTKEQRYDDPLMEELYMYLLNYLELPDAGEFSLNGGGKLTLEDGNIYITYESILKGYEDYEIGGWKDVNEKDETYSGRKQLFIP